MYSIYNIILSLHVIIRLDTVLVTKCSLLQVYYSGQSLKGSVQLVLRETKWYQYVAVSLKGSGRIYRPNNKMHIGSAQYYNYDRSTDTYGLITVLTVIWGSQNSTQPTKLDPRTYTFPFQFTIPPSCPPTFSGVTGDITHSLLGIVSSQVSTYNVETPIIIANLVDLNLRPNILQPVTQSMVKKMTTYFCCSAGETEVTIKMPQTGFCIVHDHIPVTVECRNSTSRQISLRLKIVQSIIYNYDIILARSNDTRPGNDSVTIHSYGWSISPSQSDTKSVKFDLPSSIVLGFTSQIVVVSHYVSLSVRYRHQANPAAVISIPIVIGNVPIHSAQIPSQDTAHQSAAVAGFSSVEDPRPVQPNYSPQPPTGFEST